MLGLVVGVLAMTGWRKSGAWAWIAGGLAMFAVSDSLYFYGIALGTYEEGVIYDAGWPLAVLLLAYGAWTPESPVRAGLAGERRPILLPIVFAVTSLGLLIYDHFDPTNVLALGLASSCLVAVLVRLVVTHGDNRRMLAASREEASTDALTGLGNRRSLTRELERVAAEATAERPACLAIFDLDGFKAYNDIYGHPAGDSLLIRLSSALRASVKGRGAAYRMGGDEFCVLASPEHGDVDMVLADAAEALSEHGDGFTITCSYGRVVLPRRPPAPSTPSTSRTSACTCRRTAAASRRGASPATCCCARWRSAIPRSETTSTAWRSWPSRSASGSACCPRSSRTCARRRSCTTWARSPSPTRSSTSPAR